MVLLAVDGLLFAAIVGIYLCLVRSRWRRRTLAEHLAAIARRNLPLHDAMAGLSRDFGGRLGADLERVHDRLLGGMRLGDAMAQARSIPAALRNAVALGERSGNLAAFLDEACRGLAHIERIRRRSELSLIYPMFLSIVTTVAVGIYAFAVAPLILLAEAPVPPWIDWATRNADALAFACGVVTVMGFLLLAGMQAFRPRRLDRDAALQEVAVTLGIYLRAGATLVEAVRAAADLDVHRTIRARMAALAKHLEEGGTIHAFLDTDKTLPRDFGWMVAVGGAGGNLHESLLRAAAVYAGRREAADHLKARLLGPAFVLLNGLIVFGVAYGVVATLGSFTIEAMLW